MDFHIVITKSLRQVICSSRFCAKLFLYQSLEQKESVREETWTTERNRSARGGQQDI